MASDITPGARDEPGPSPSESGDAARREGAQPGVARAQQPFVEACWDPYQVWLTRVKQPRDQSARRQSRPGAVDAAKTADRGARATPQALTAALPR